MTSFTDSVGRAVHRLGPARARAIAAGIEAGASLTTLCASQPVPGYADAARAIRLSQTEEGVTDIAATAYLRGAADGYERHANSERIEAVWSGPISHDVPVRSTTQALVDLVHEATSELLLMTYSAKPHPPVIDALTDARSRGVLVSVVVETLQGAGGALAGVEPAAAFIQVPGIELWHWPPAARTEHGAKMHAKIAVADRRTLLVSSANLTQSGISTNIEAGVLVHGGHAPRRAAEHVKQLIATGVLARLSAVGA